MGRYNNIRLQLAFEDLHGILICTNRAGPSSRHVRVLEGDQTPRARPHPHAGGSVRGRQLTLVNPGLVSRAYTSVLRNASTEADESKMHNIGNQYSSTRRVTLNCKCAGAV